MEFKYYFKNEEKACYAISLIVFLLGIFCYILTYTDSGFTLETAKTLAGLAAFELVILYFASLFSAERRNFEKWYNDLINKGVKCNGTVTQIDMYDNNVYKLSVCYYSEVHKCDLTVTLPKIKFKEPLDTKRTVLCDVYENRQYDKLVNYDSELIEVSQNKINFSINPIKLLMVIHKKYNREFFGNAIACAFKYK
jgi:hypothetical protein